MKSEYDVVVAGYGPAGAISAKLLAKGGLKVLVVDKLAEVFDKPRAIGMDHEALRVLQFCEIAHELFPHMRQYRGALWRASDGTVLRRFEPSSKAKYVAFTTLADPRQMPGLRYRSIDWPYREGLRIDEAMHPLALLATGLYGKPLPQQNGAPLRLVVPWKYGFKSIKSIVAIRFTERMPKTAWNRLQPSEYGFFSNVNPDVDHPRWSQKTERRIAGTRSKLFAGRIPTLPFNGYGDQVAALYAGMDLRKWY